MYCQSEKTTVCRILLSGHPQNLLEEEQTVEVESEGCTKVEAEAARARVAGCGIVGC